jgi:hypothetical protein
MLYTEVKLPTFYLFFKNSQYHGTVTGSMSDWHTPEPSHRRGMVVRLTSMVNQILLPDLKKNGNTLE